MKRDIVIDTMLPHAPEVVWRALTTAELIGKWLMPNNFKAELGHKFTFHAKPMGDWDGTVQCEVIAIEPPRRLAYSWKRGSTSNPGYGSALDSTVTWTLEPADGGTRLTLVHAGFELPRNQSAYDAMSPGWGRIVREGIARVVAQLPSS